MLQASKVRPLDVLPAIVWGFASTVGTTVATGKAITTAGIANSALVAAAALVTDALFGLVSEVVGEALACKRDHRLGEVHFQKSSEHIVKIQHHLGGIENLGPVSTETRVFVEPWEKRIFGIHTVMMAESAHLSNALHPYPVEALPTTFSHDWTWASLRTGAEDMQPFEYFKYRYYEKWLGGISQFFVNQGYITAEELSEKTEHYRANTESALPEKPATALAAQIDAYLLNGDSGYRPLKGAARFVQGDTVRIADPDAVDHTRLPGYLRNKTGVVDLIYPGAFSYFVSTGVDGIGEPMPVYRIAFDAADIWGVGKSEANTTIYADLYDAYVLSAH
ncbi:nitrile hydratase [Paraburkholderia terricola]|uniref:nitrile hydratase subunit beta n=1 Tax=Paraburkholderia terricola TaxID=169427 RepID=UPI00285C9719|nr:nitrile hydratase subunit beta [Paraburkholderia terricola]MDR6495678.1 nitrile hydratase [Paraburkholderia terricola]